MALVLSIIQAAVSRAHHRVLFHAGRRREKMGNKVEPWGRRTCHLDKRTVRLEALDRPADAQEIAK
jgi:hypothetical protein